MKGWFGIHLLDEQGRVLDAVVSRARSSEDPPAVVLEAGSAADLSESAFGQAVFSLTTFASDDPAGGCDGVLLVAASVAVTPPGLTGRTVGPARPEGEALRSCGGRVSASPAEAP